MMENRDYMRSDPSPPSPFRWTWSVSTLLIVVLPVVYALQCLDAVYFHTNATSWLALTSSGIKSGCLWQLLTFQFLHGSFTHLLWNLLALWFFGRQVEHILGSRRFAVAYLGAGVIGGALQVALMIFFPQHFGGIAMGASAGLSGAFAIFAMLERESVIRWNFLIPIRAMTLLMIYVGVELFFTLVPVPGAAGTAHAAHLGGLLAGIGWVKLGWHRDHIVLPWEGVLSRWRNWRTLNSRQREGELVRAAVRAESSKRPKPAAAAELPPDQFISREVDPILDKISAHGIHSLTPREREILEAARARMARR